MSTTVLNLEKPYTGRYAFSHLGFRPFFLAAAGFAILGMVLWAGIYGFGWHVLQADYPSVSWHAHEMIFGYAVAVVAGFLLTAIRNWTNRPTLNGLPLLGLAGAWLLARLLPLVKSVPLVVLAGVDMLFLLGLTVSVAYPIWRAGQWQQLGLVGKVALLLPANGVFYLGLLGYWPVGITVGLYTGFYLILALIFNMGRRVIPFFIERGVGCPFTAHNDRWLDRFSLILFLLFAVADVVTLASGNRLALFMAAVLALVQVPLHVFRLLGWHHPQLWQKPLLWVLYLAYGWIIAGFILKFLALATGISPWLAVHAFAYGGIGMMTAGMMARVSLGHTGRNVFTPPPILLVVFMLLFAGSWIRVLNVWMIPELAAVWILASQILWVVAFAVFVWHYLPMLVLPRIDGHYG